MVKFLLKDRLDELNADRQRDGEPPLSWSDVAREIGVTRQMLATLAGNTSLIATSTRVIEACCRFFRCGPEKIFELHPPPAVPYSCRADVLYGPEEQRKFRDSQERQQIGLPPVRTMRRTRRR